MGGGVGSPLTRIKASPADRLEHESAVQIIMRTAREGRSVRQALERVRGLCRVTRWGSRRAWTETTVRYIWEEVMPHEK